MLQKVEDELFQKIGNALSICVHLRNLRPSASSLLTCRQAGAQPSLLVGPQMDRLSATDPPLAARGADRLPPARQKRRHERMLLRGLDGYARECHRDREREMIALGARRERAPIGRMGVVYPHRALDEAAEVGVLGTRLELDREAEPNGSLRSSLRWQLDRRGWRRFAWLTLSWRRTVSRRRS